MSTRTPSLRGDREIARTSVPLWLSTKTPIISLPTTKHNEPPPISPPTHRYHNLLSFQPPVPIRISAATAPMSTIDVPRAYLANRNSLAGLGTTGILLVRIGRVWSQLPKGVAAT